MRQLRMFHGSWDPVFKHISIKSAAKRISRMHLLKQSMNSISFQKRTTSHTSKLIGTGTIPCSSATSDFDENRTFIDFALLSVFTDWPLISYEFIDFLNMKSWGPSPANRFTNSYPLFHPTNIIKNGMPTCNNNVQTFTTQGGDDLKCYLALHEANCARCTLLHPIAWNLDRGWPIEIWNAKHLSSCCYL